MYGREREKGESAREKKEKEGLMRYKSNQATS